MEEDDYTHLFKIILIGDSGVGKTNIFNRFQNKEFSLDSRPTIGVEFINKTVKIDNQSVKCQIWDTAGQEKFRAITNAYYRGAQGAFVCFDVTKQNTFESTLRWLQEIRQYGDPNIVVTLLGNKIDLAEQRIVRTDEVVQFCDQNKVGLMETSALNNKNVEQAFDWMIGEIYKQIQQRPKSDYNLGQTYVLDQKVKTNQKQKKDCC